MGSYDEPERIEPRVQLTAMLLSSAAAAAGLLHLFRPWQTEALARLHNPPGGLFLVGAVELGLGVLIALPRSRPWASAALTALWMGAVMWHVMTGYMLGFLLVYLVPITTGIWLFLKTRPPSMHVTH